MSHVIKRDIFRKPGEGEERAEKNEKRDERQSDELSKRAMKTFQVAFLFVLQIGSFIQ